jgi:hypothetical protein
VRQRLLNPTWSAIETSQGRGRPIGANGAPERSKLQTEWLALAKAAEQQEEDGVLIQPESKLGRPEGGVRAASRELGI